MGYVGKCFCGAVEVEATGAPEAMGYCHCSSCRSWSAGPVNAFTLWKADAVKVKSGAEHVGTFEKTAFSQRMYCKKCGGHLMTGHKPVGLVDVYAATIPHAEIRSRGSRELRRDGAADEGRPSQDEGFSGRARRLRRDAAGVA